MCQERAASTTLAVWLALAAGPAGAAPAGFTGRLPPEPPDRLGAAWAAALAVGDDQPERAFAAWRQVLAERAGEEAWQRRELPGSAPTKPYLSVDGLFARKPSPPPSLEHLLVAWQRLRPDSAGPDLMRVLQEELGGTREAVVSLLDRHPDDPMLIWHAAHLLRKAGEAPRGRQILTRWVQRRVAAELPHRLLADHDQLVGDKGQLETTLLDWFERGPRTTALLRRWLDSDLAARESGRTRQLVDAVVREPQGADALAVCHRLTERLADRDRGRACLRRLADSAGSDSVVAQAALRAEAILAAQSNDAARLTQALEMLPDSDRAQTRIVTALALPTPERCADRVTLIKNAAATPHWEPGLARAMTVALRPCLDQIDARAVFERLLAQTDGEDLAGVVLAAAERGNGTPRFPVEVEDLTARLRSAVDARESSELLTSALDLAYEVAGRTEARLALETAWNQRSPRLSLAAAQSQATADFTFVHGNQDGLVELIELQRSARPEVEVSGSYWSLYVTLAGPRRAERMAAELMADPSPATPAFLLAAQAARSRGDHVLAASRYRSYLARVRGNLLVAVELVALLAENGELDRVPATAAAFCRGPFDNWKVDSAECARLLLDWAQVSTSG